MILTGKAKEDFEKWYSDTDSEIKHSLLTSLFQSKSNIEKYAYYIEWFDSAGIYIDVYAQTGLDEVAYNFNIYPTYANLDYYPTRQEATKQAILKANEIYNLNNN